MNNRFSTVFILLMLSLLTGSIYSDHPSARIPILIIGVLLIIGGAVCVVYRTILNQKEIDQIPIGPLLPRQYSMDGGSALVLWTEETEKIFTEVGELHSEDVFCPCMCDGCSFWEINRDVLKDCRFSPLSPSFTYELQNPADIFVKRVTGKNLSVFLEALSKQDYMELPVEELRHQAEGWQQNHLITEIYC
ncbi:MAG: hypothetical protein HPY50_02385 [Firmicutes bacterium]|nr:hypothetical protein [Bacillota bacterium]